MKKLLVATGNQDKVTEIKEKYRDLEFEIVSPGELNLELDVEETGSTLEENALLKARAGAEKTGLLTLADDTGLAVDALDGRPGVYSARFAGPDASYEDNNRRLLKLLEDIPDEKRQAAFCTVAALVDPERNLEVTVEGRLEGRILTEFRGKQGFGYDPIFFLPERGKALAELSLGEKNAISHRARALEKMKSKLQEIYHQTG